MRCYAISITPIHNYINSSSFYYVSRSNKQKQSSEVKASWILSSGSCILGGTTDSKIRSQRREEKSIVRVSVKGRHRVSARWSTSEWVQYMWLVYTSRPTYQAVCAVLCGRRVDHWFLSSSTVARQSTFVVSPWS